ncbi:unnamed protein product [Onchocerca ochengi]|uniref:ATP-dependent DNA helicase n=1 Tax=Onchocerca ochengi TaxID=42157 RepID=A0A182E062_ONCOC|nr:unnamed protein product [Onchocerca ochengi]
MSVDIVVEADETVNYPTEFLNSLDLPGMPPHMLQLKISVPVIMLRNINQPELCNATRLAVKKLMSNVVETTISTGPFKGPIFGIVRFRSRHIIVHMDNYYTLSVFKSTKQTTSISMQTME